MTDVIWKMENEPNSKSLPLRSLTRAEERRTYANERRALLDCDLEIVAHAHREVVETPSDGAGPPRLIAQAAQTSKEKPRVLRVGGERRHGHQSFEFQTWKFADLFAEREDFVGRGARFGLLAAEVDFDEDRQRLAGFGREAVEPFGEFDVVYGLDGVEEFDRAPRLVRLQMSDQMPLDFALGADRAQLGDLGGGLLDAAFAERADARFNGLADAGGGDCLADGDERDFGSLSAGALACRRYTSIDLLQPRPQILRPHCERPTPKKRRARSFFPLFFALFASS